MPDQAPVLDLHELLSAAEDVPPAAAVIAAARHLEERLAVESVSFWIADFEGLALSRLPDGEQVSLDGTPAGEAWRDQRLVRASSLWAPVTVRGDAQGVLEVRPAGGEPPGEDLVDQVRAVAHTLGYVIVANQRHTDAFEIARRSRPFELSMEIQRRLLPQSFVCEGGSFALAGWLEPSAGAGGDTFDYTASPDRLSLALVDAVGHDVTAALLATLAVNATRNSRRQGAGVTAQAAAAHEALDRYAGAEQYATGLLLELPLSAPADLAAPGGDDPGTGEGPVACRVVNAGHPPMRLLRAGRVEPVELAPDPPLGLPLRQQVDGYTTHEVELLPGDRLVLLTDGMYETSAADFDLDGLLVATAEAHPRNAVQDIATAFREHVEGDPDDDATLLVLDWYGGTTRRRARSGADVED